MSGPSDGEAHARLARFLQDELSREDLPQDLQTEYTARLERVSHERLLDDPTPVAELDVHPRARAALERAGVDTIAKLASMSETERALLPYMGRQFVAEVREALARRAARA
jgi:DNA-directed RNA polymerase alpha subunit